MRVLGAVALFLVISLLAWTLDVLLGNPSGTYELRVGNPGGNYYLQRPFSLYPDGPYVASSDRPLQPYEGRRVWVEAKQVNTASTMKHGGGINVWPGGIDAVHIDEIFLVKNE